ncbi:DUF4143 domain-containing protein [soil metagenome]
MTRETFLDDAYRPRTVDLDLDELFGQLPAVLLDGAKGVGKTRTALQRAATVRRLDDPRERSIVEADPNVAVLGDQPVLIDEWQRAPSSWDAVKRAVDADPRGGQFLLTGSAPAAGEPVHSGAGRITTLRMRPMTLPERRISTPTVRLSSLLSGENIDIGGRCDLDLAGYTDEILSSGLPGMRGLTGRALWLQLDGYIERIVDREMPEAGLSARRPASVRNWLRAYAAATATTATWETVRDAATPGSGDKPAKSTTAPYIDTLTTLRVLDEQPAWEPGHNHLRRLTRGAKHHLVDPALAARLVGVGRNQLLRGEAGDVAVPRDGTFLGGLFESLAVLTIRVFAQAADASVFHLRDFDGRHEIDLIVERGDGRILALEVKLSSTLHANDFKNLRWLRDRIGDQMIGGAVLTTGPEAYRREDGFAVLPLGLLGP